jgi:hypothetical protein
MLDIAGGWLQLRIKVKLKTLGGFEQRTYVCQVIDAGVRTALGQLNVCVVKPFEKRSINIYNVRRCWKGTSTFETR